MDWTLGVDTSRNFVTNAKCDRCTAEMSQCDTDSDRKAPPVFSSPKSAKASALRVGNDDRCSEVSLDENDKGTARSKSGGGALGRGVDGGPVVVMYASNRR